MTSEGDEILFAYTLDGSGGGGELSSVDAVTSKDFWIHLQSDAPNCPQTLRKLGLSELVIESMTTMETRPRAQPMDDGTLIVLRGVNTGVGADPEDMVSLRIWLSDSMIITARKAARRLMSIQDVRDQLLKSTGPRDSGEFLTMVVERLSYYIGQVVDSIEDDLVAIEDSVATEAGSALRARLAQTRREAATLKRYLAPQRDALDLLFRAHSALTEAQAYELRELADRNTRYVEDLDLARERAMLLQEEMRNQIAEQQNQRMYVLSLVTAIFLPLSFLTGVFGMNVMGLPGLNDPLGFVLVAGTMLLIALSILVWMRFQKWF